MVVVVGNETTTANAWAWHLWKMTLLTPVCAGSEAVRTPSKPGVDSHKGDPKGRFAVANDESGAQNRRRVGRIIIVIDLFHRCQRQRREGNEDVFFVSTKVWRCDYNETVRMLYTLLKAHGRGAAGPRAKLGRGAGKSKLSVCCRRKRPRTLTGRKCCYRAACAGTNNRHMSVVRCWCWRRLDTVLIVEPTLESDRDGPRVCRLGVFCGDGLGRNRECGRCSRIGRARVVLLLTCLPIVRGTHCGY